MFLVLGRCPAAHAANQAAPRLGTAPKTGLNPSSAAWTTMEAALGRTNARNLPKHHLQMTEIQQGEEAGRHQANSGKKSGYQE